jgi:predicted phage terminase large subunit-like protein
MVQLPKDKEGRAYLYSLLKEKEKRLCQRSLESFVTRSDENYLVAYFHRIIFTKLEQFLQDVLDKKSPRLIITLPPRHGKSFICSERFPTWALGKNPKLHFTCCSYAAELASKFSRKSLQFIKTPFYQNIFGQILGDKQTEGLFETKEGGSLRAVGTGGALSGFDSHVLVLDDTIKGLSEATSESYKRTLWEWYTSEARVRLFPGGGILLLNTRWATSDLPGQLLELEKHGGEVWDYLSFPAIAEKDDEYRKKGDVLHPERYPLEELNKIRIAVGSKTWNSLYQCNPSTDTGNEVKREWLQYYEILPVDLTDILISVDTSFKDSDSSDYVGITVWAKRGQQAYLLDIVHKKMGFTDTLQSIRATLQKYPDATVLIEEKANGFGIIQILKTQFNKVIPFVSSDSKLARLRTVSPIIEAKNVFLPKYASWLSEYENELLEFPYGDNDDLVDSTSQALIRLFKRSTEFNPNAWI